MINKTRPFHTQKSSIQLYSNGIMPENQLGPGKLGCVGENEVDKPEECSSLPEFSALNLLLIFSGIPWSERLYIFSFPS